MRRLGIAALVLTALSFLFWIISWGYWTFAIKYFGESDVLHYVAIAVSFLGSLSQSVALALVCYAIINRAGRQLPKE